MLLLRLALSLLHFKAFVSLSSNAKLQKYIHETDHSGKSVFDIQQKQRAGSHFQHTTVPNCSVMKNPELEAHLPGFLQSLNRTASHSFLH